MSVNVMSVIVMFGYPVLLLFIGFGSDALKTVNHQFLCLVLMLNFAVTMLCIGFYAIYAEQRYGSDKQKKLSGKD